MGLWSKIKETYKKIDQKVGGYLPGGVAPGSSSGGSSSSGGTSSGSTSSGSSSTSSSTPSSSSSSSGKTSGGSSGGGDSLISKISSAYQSIDTMLGGYLPGGQTPAQVQAQKQAEQGKTLLSQQKTTSTTGTTTSQTTSQNKTSSSGGSSPLSFLTNQSSNNPFATTSSQNQSIAPNPQSSLSQKISALESTPLGKPVIEDNRGTIKKGFDKAVDFVSGQTGGVWLTHFGRPTGMESSEIKEEFKQSTAKGIKDTILIGIPVVAGFTPEGKFKTAWSKDKDKKIDLTGLGQPNPLANVQREWSKSAEKIRKSGILTTLEQQAQATAIENTIKEIEDLTKSYSGDLTSQDITDIAFGKKTIDDIYKDKSKAPGIQAKQFEKEVEAYQKQVESFNTKYGGKELAPDIYEKALEEKTKIDAERDRLIAKQSSISKAYEDYESRVVSKVAGLREIGVQTKVDKNGNIVFSSKALDTKVAPVGMKLEKDFMKDGKITWKNVAYSGGSFAHTTAEAVLVGFATGGTGVIAKVGVGVAKLPKVAQVVIKGGAITLAVGGVASKGYSGYKLAQQVDVPGWYGATLGTATGIGQVGGFAVGGYYGTKAYYSGVQDKILAGKYTKSIGEMREGKIQVDLKSGTAKGGLAKQVGIYETKVKGTEWTIKSGVKMQGLYGKESGMSNVKISSQFQGKAPKGMPKGWTTKGQTLESGDYARLRAFTKSSKGKLWYEQDFLMKRTMLERLKVDVSQKPAFKGYSELERLKFLTGMKSVGKPVKVGKVLPEQVWKSEELFRFAQYKGQGKVMQPWEWIEAKPDSIFATKQFVLYKHTKPQSATFKTKGGDLKISSTELGIKEFQSIGQTRGASAELLKQQLKDTILVIKESQVNMMSDKSGQLTIMRPKPSASTIQKTYTPQVTKPTTFVDTKALLKIQLSKIVPGLISKQVSGLKTSTLLFGAGISGIKQILQTRQSLAVMNEQDLLQRTRQVSLQKMLQQQAPSQAQSIRQAQAVQQVPLQTPIMQAPEISTPIVTGFPGVPKISRFDKPDLFGWKYKQPKESLAGNRTSSYIPDFTAKALGLKPKIMDKAQLKNLLRTDFTGLEVRRGVIPTQ